LIVMFVNLLAGLPAFDSVGCQHEQS
jgi:hypothetical protein